MPSGYFQTTYEGARQGLGTIGTAIQNIAQEYATRKKEERAKQEKLGFLKTFGIVKENEPELKDYQSEAKSLDKTIKFAKDITPEKQLGYYKKTFDYLKLPHPKGKGYTLDTEKIKNLPSGVSITDVVPGVTLKGTDATASDTLSRVKLTTWMKSQTQGIDSLSETEKELINVGGKKPTSLSLKKLALSEAKAQMGGSLLAPISLQDPVKKKEYDGLVSKLYKGYLKEYNITDNLQEVETTEVEEDIYSNIENMEF